MSKFQNLRAFARDFTDAAKDLHAEAQRRKAGRGGRTSAARDVATTSKTLSLRPSAFRQKVAKDERRGLAVDARGDFGVGRSRGAERLFGVA